MTSDFQNVKVYLVEQSKYITTYKSEVIKIKPFAKLRGRIVEKYGSQAKFAEALGVTEQTVTGKLNGKTQFTIEDIVEWCNLLEIESEEVNVYFFAEKLSKS